MDAVRYLIPNCFLLWPELPLVQVRWDFDDVDGEAGEGSSAPKLKHLRQALTAAHPVPLGVPPCEDGGAPPHGYSHPWQ
jgi:hypothetical protein